MSVRLASPSPRRSPMASPLPGAWLAALAIAGATILGGWIGDRADVLKDASATATSDTCAEDDPCWDCATMGNRICGMTP